MRAPAIRRNCVGQYMITGLHLTPALRAILESAGWQFSYSHINPPRGNYALIEPLTQPQRDAIAAHTAARLRIHFPDCPLCNGTGERRFDNPTHRVVCDCRPAR